mgnify:CR=1 FL=1
MNRFLIPKSSYQTNDGEILETRMLTESEKYFKIALVGNKYLEFEPGQFVMVGIPGVGEAPISRK